MENRIILMDEAMLEKQFQQIKEEIREILAEKGMSEQPDEVMSAAEVCRMLKKSRQTIENWSRNGVLRKRTMGDSVFYLRSEIIETLRHNNKSY